MSVTLYSNICDRVFQTASRFNTLLVGLQLHYGKFRWYLFKSKEIMLNPSELNSYKLLIILLKLQASKTIGSSFWAGTHMEINASLTFLSNSFLFMNVATTTSFTMRSHVFCNR